MVAHGHRALRARTRRILEARRIDFIVRMAIGVRQLDLAHDHVAAERKLLAGVRRRDGALLVESDAQRLVLRRPMRGRVRADYDGQHRDDREGARITEGTILHANHKHTFISGCVGVVFDTVTTGRFAAHSKRSNRTP